MGSSSPAVGYAKSFVHEIRLDLVAWALLVLSIASDAANIMRSGNFKLDCALAAKTLSR